MTESILLPMLPMREEVIFPHMTVPFFVGRKPSMEALDQALARDRQIFVVTQNNASIENPSEKDLFSIGTLGKIVQIMRLPNGTVKALYEAKQRARIISTQLHEGVYMARVEPIFERDSESQAMRDIATETLRLLEVQWEYTKKKNKEENLENLRRVTMVQLADSIIPFLEITREDKQMLLEILDPLARLDRVLSLIQEEMEIKSLEDKLRKQVHEQIKNTQKEGYLQDQLRSIQRELGHFEDNRTEIDEMSQKIKDAKMSKEAEEVALREMKKLKMMSAMSSEANVVRNYLEWLLNMPWHNRTEDNFDLKHAQSILDEDHFGLEKVKERIIEYLAVAILKGSLKGPIICLVGPPGVGKTSLAKSIARALNRKFVRMSLGGVRDEAEIRGHRRTYIGAMPGKIIQSIRKAKSKNPLLLMDEIDKLYQSNMSDPSAALLEVLDPEQNNTFMDHYLEVEYSLKDVLFLCTANSTQSIPTPLLDRMEVIQLTGYSEIEKHHIAMKFLVPKQISIHGLNEKQLNFRDSALAEIIRRYTREAGVRNLEREIGKVCRKIVTKLVRSKSDKNVTVNIKTVHKLLGVPPFQYDTKEENNEIGVSMGLGVTQMGGELLLVEVGSMSGTGKLMLTGKLGEIMQESAQAAYTYVRSNSALLGIDNSFFTKMDFHIHLPEGAIPKDGPSAGLPLVTAIVSALTKIPVRHDVAMTGEITLRGQVTEIGGLKEKLLAAKRGMIKEVIIPKDNEKDLVEVPKEILEDLKLHAVNFVDEALHIALERFPEVLANKAGDLNKEHLGAGMVTNVHAASTAL